MVHRSMDGPSENIPIVCGMLLVPPPKTTLSGICLMWSNAMGKAKDGYCFV